MATEAPQPYKRSMRCSTALATLLTAGTNKQYEVVKRSGTAGGSGTTAYAVGDVVAVAAATDIPAGILQNKPKAGSQAELVVIGRTKMVCAGTLNPGDPVAFDTTGRAVAVTTALVATASGFHQATQYVIGFLDQDTAAATGDIVTVSVNCLAPLAAY